MRFGRFGIGCGRRKDEKAIMTIGGTILDIIRMNQEVKSLSEKVSSLAKEMRSMDGRLIKAETCLEMIYDIAVGRQNRRSEEPPPAPSLPDQR